MFHRDRCNRDALRSVFLFLYLYLFVFLVLGWGENEEAEEAEEEEFVARHPTEQGGYISRN